jgi:twitching motility protein PilT
VLEAVVSQVLVHSTDGGRLAAFEIMLATNVIMKLIRDEEKHEILPNIEMGTLEGMQTLDQAHAELVKKKRISAEDALMQSTNPATLRKFIVSLSEELTLQNVS